MASGDTLMVFTPQHNQPFFTNFATFDTRNNHIVLDFDDAVDESAVFGSVLPVYYSGGGLTVTLVWLATTAIINDVVWQAQIERHEDDVTDLDSASFAALQFAAAATTASASGEPKYTAITFTDGAQMDSLAAGESFRLRIDRDADSTNDTDNLVGDAELLRVVMTET